MIYTQDRTVQTTQSILNTLAGNLFNCSTYVELGGILSHG